MKMEAIECNQTCQCWTRTCVWHWTRLPSEVLVLRVERSYFRHWGC